MVPFVDLQIDACELKSEIAGETHAAPRQSCVQTDRAELRGGARNLLRVPVVNGFAGDRSGKNLPTDHVNAHILA